jgi:hypothetical protein
VLIVLKSWSIHFLEPSGPAQACNGIAFTNNFRPLVFQKESKFIVEFNYAKFCLSRERRISGSKEWLSCPENNPKFEDFYVESFNFTAD